MTGKKQYFWVIAIASGSETKWNWQVFSGFLATLDDAGFPRKALYELLRRRAEGHDVQLSLTDADKSLFTTIANKMSTYDSPLDPNWGLGRSNRRNNGNARELTYQPWSGSQNHITVNDISYPVRYIDATEVDWWMERKKIIIPNDFQTVRNFLFLKKMGIWNFAGSPNEIKSMNECWQNILIVS